MRISKLPDFPISEFNVNTFNTPLAYSNKKIFTVNVENDLSKNNGEFPVDTIIRQFDIKKPEDGWISNIIEDETIADKYHTQPSIAVDKLGYLHVVYNMHNLPWQYKVSSKPEDISDFVFKGQKITKQDKVISIKKNKTSFPTIGSSNIPGNQITYPAFFYDNKGEIYISYRYSVTPKQKFGKRLFSGGIAKYDVDTDSWHQIGGKVYLNDDDIQMTDKQKQYVTNPFASSSDWWIYFPRLAFDSGNNMHIVWSWRKNIPGREMEKLGYGIFNTRSNIFLDHGKNQISLPIKVNNHRYVLDKFNEYKGHFAQVSFSISNAKPSIVYTSIKDKKRKIIHWNSYADKWSNPEIMPSSSSIYININNIEYAFATGPKIYSRRPGYKWKNIYTCCNKNKYGHLRLLHVKEEKLLLLYGQDFGSQAATVFQLKY